MSSVIEITDTQFEQELANTEKLVLVYCWASWCGPCRLVSPSINWVADHYSDRLKVLKLEVDPNPQTVSRFQVEGVPALILLQNNQVIATHEGAIPKQQIQSFIENHLN